MPGTIQDLEDEIAKLEAEVYGSPEEEQAAPQEVEQEPQQEEPPLKEETPKEVVAEDPEEGNFKKRYGDLRRHSQKQKEELDKALKRLEELEKQSRTNGLPSAEEAEEWAKANPKAAAIIRAIAVSETNPRTSEIEKIKEQLNRAEQEAKVLKSHPDFPQISESEEFHEWAESQPARIQDFIYSTDADEVIWAVDQFKRLKASPQKPNTDAAKAVPVKTTATPPDTKTPRFYESEVSKMSVSEYEKKESEILAAMREGLFVYDLSGAAR